MKDVPTDDPTTAGHTVDAHAAELERWRLVLGDSTDSAFGGNLTKQNGARDAALSWLYGQDDEQEGRGVRGGGNRARPGDDRTGGSGDSVVAAVDWLDDIQRLFPKRTLERLERDAIEKYGITDIVTDPAVLARVQPNATLLKAIMRTKHLMNPEVLAMARRIVEAVVKELMERLATELNQAFNGSLSRRPGRLRQARNFDYRRTLRANLGHYQVDERRVLIETPYFFSRTRRQIDTWQVILLVDQSGSMLESVIHSAVTAACLWGLPGIKTHLVAFDTNVVDLTPEVDDPVEILMKVQLGGGTDIGKAVQYATQLVENPRRSIVVVISDFYEGGDDSQLVRSVRSLVENGSVVIGLAALDEAANPAFDRDLGQRLADVGAHVGAMTPGELAAFIAEKVGR